MENIKDTQVNEVNATTEGTGAKNSKINKVKKHSLFFGITLVLAIVVGGTFAFQMLSQVAFTPDLVQMFPGGRVHHVSELNEAVHGTRNRNVFAENFGDAPLGIRIQLFEYVEVHGVPFDNPEIPTAIATEENPIETPPTDTDGENPMSINNVGTWSVFQAGHDLERLPGTTAYRIGELGIELTLGQPDETPKIYMPTFNRINRPVTSDQVTASLVAGDVDMVNSIFVNESAFRFADTSGRAVSALAGGFDIQDSTQVQNIGDIDDQRVTIGTTGTPGHTGLRNFFALNTPREDYRYRFDGELGHIVREEVTHYAQEALEPDFGGVMSLTRWNELNQPEGNFWIMDNVNPGGWFYWNGFLLPGEGDTTSATSLLLSTTTLPVHASLAYVIRINADFFTRGNLPDDISAEAREIFGVDADEEEYEEYEEYSFDLNVTPAFTLTALVENEDRIVTSNNDFETTRRAFQLHNIL